MKIIRLGTRFFDLHSPADCARISPGALRMFFQLLQDWRVPEPQGRTLLGRMTDEDFARLRTDPQAWVLEPAKLKRIACLLNISRELTLLYGASIADEWPLLPNSHPMFSRVTPFMYMLIGGAQAMDNVQRLLVRRRRTAADCAAADAAHAAEAGLQSVDRAERGSPNDTAGASAERSAGASADSTTPSAPLPGPPRG